jgi:hypothetical protein
LKSEVRWFSSKLTTHPPRKKMTEQVYPQLNLSLVEACGQAQKPVQSTTSKDFQELIALLEFLYEGVGSFQGRLLPLLTKLSKNYDGVTYSVENSKYSVLCRSPTKSDRCRSRFSDSTYGCTRVIWMREEAYARVVLHPR